MAALEQALAKAEQVAKDLSARVGSVTAARTEPAPPKGQAGLLEKALLGADGAKPGSVEVAKAVEAAVAVQVRGEERHGRAADEDTGPQRGQCSKGSPQQPVVVGVVARSASSQVGWCWRRDIDVCAL